MPATGWTHVTLSPLIDVTRARIRRNTENVSDASTSLRPAWSCRLRLPVPRGGQVPSTRARPRGLALERAAHRVLAAISYSWSRNTADIASSAVSSRNGQKVDFPRDLSGSVSRIDVHFYAQNQARIAWFARPEFTSGQDSRSVQPRNR